MAFEKAPHSTHFQQLQERGIKLPAPVDLSDAKLHAKLWEVLRELAKMNVFLISTDHLSDRELDAQLWSDVLHEDTIEGPLPDMACHLDLVSSGSKEDIALWMRLLRRRRDAPAVEERLPRGKAAPAAEASARSRPQAAQAAARLTAARRNHAGSASERSSAASCISQARTPSGPSSARGS